MSPNQLRTMLETSKVPPARALRLSSDQAETLLPMLIETMDKAAGGVFLMPRHEQFLRHGLCALAVARCHGLYQPLMRWLRSPHTDVERVFGWHGGECLPGIILAVFDGDAAPLTEVIEDPTVDGEVRWDLFDAFARLVFDGAISREAALGLIDRFDDKRLAEDDDPAWEGWQNVVSLLGLEERADRVRASWVNGRHWQAKSFQEDWEEELARALAAPSDPARFIEMDLCPLDDAVAALTPFHDEVELGQPAAAAVDDCLPEDPAAKIVLGDDELEWLACFLRSSQAPDTAMDLEELDGFFTAMVVGPKTIMPNMYMPEIWGGDGEGPVYDSLEQAEYVTGLLMRHWNAMIQRQDHFYPCMPFVADDPLWPKGYLWAQGFARGIDMCPDAWEPLLEDDIHAELLVPVSALGDDPELLEYLGDPEIRETMLDAALLAVHGLYAYWHGKDEPTSIIHEKTRRNEPCPCGSGRKYQRCCGSPTVSMAIH